MHRGRPSQFDASVHTTSRDRTNALRWFDPAYGTVGIEGLVVETARASVGPEAAVAAGRRVSLP